MAGTSVPNVVVLAEHNGSTSFISLHSTQITAYCGACSTCRGGFLAVGTYVVFVGKGLDPAPNVFAFKSAFSCYIRAQHIDI